MQFKLEKRGDDIVIVNENGKVAFKNPKVCIIGKILDFEYDENNQLIIKSIKVDNLKLST